MLPYIDRIVCFSNDSKQVNVNSKHFEGLIMLTSASLPLQFCDLNMNVVDLISRILLSYLFNFVSLSDNP